MSPLIDWQIATVLEIKQETENVKTFTLSLPDWVEHRSDRRTPGGWRGIDLSP
jgi:ferredoxin-NADP reductase